MNGDESFWKSAIQKGVRRGDVALLEEAWNWLHLHGLGGWIRWRFPVLVAEDSWNVLAACGDEALAALNSAEKRWAVLKQAALAAKNPDAAHLSSIARWMANDHVLQAACRERLAGEQLVELELMTWAVNESVAGRPEAMWSRLRSLGDENGEAAGAAVRLCRWRAHGHGSDSDKWLMVGAAVLAALRPRPQVRMTDGTHCDEEESWPPWYCADMHTKVGKQVIRELSLGPNVATAWFLFESRRYQPDGLDQNSLFEELGFEAAFRQHGLTVAEGRALWERWAPQVRTRVKQLLAGGPRQPALL